MSEGEVLKEQLPKFLPAKEIIGCEAKQCFMLYDASPGHFFVLPIESADQFDEIANALATFPLPGSKVLENPSVGVACIAPFKCWFDRARISAQLPENRFTVQSVDYGFTADVAANKIYAIPTVLLATPPLAIGCALHGVETWSEKKAAEFKKLVYEERTFDLTFAARRDGTAEGEIVYEVKMAVSGKDGLINDRIGESAADEETVVTDATVEKTSDAAAADLEENGKANGKMSPVSALPTGVNSDEFSVAKTDQPAVPLTCDIDKLADVDLAKIFKYLPAVDRLLVSEICKRWHTITKQAWLEITHLDLSPIPGPNIAPIISLCPNLRHVSAMVKSFDLNELRILSRICLSSLKLYGWRCILPPCTAVVRSDPMSAIFSSNLRNAVWDELVLDDLFLLFSGSDDFFGEIEFPASFPASLKRLQVSGDSFLALGCSQFYDLQRCLRGIEQLRNLECLILLTWRDEVPVWHALHDSKLLPSIASLQNLRELALGSSRERWGYANYNLALCLLDLPRLETLVLDNFAYLDRRRENFEKLVTKHPTLRILVLSGHVSLGKDDVQFPARLRYGNGVSAAPLPQLHIFVGKAASKRILFPRFPSDAAKVYPISEALPRFLEREDIKPIFEGVWIAAQIKEADRPGNVLCDYERDLATSFRTIAN